MLSFLFVGVAAQIDAGRSVNEGNARYKFINNRILTMTAEFIAGDRSRGRFLKGCAINLAELPLPNLEQAADDIIVHALDGKDNGVFNWATFDHIGGLDNAADAVIWQPWV